MNNTVYEMITDAIIASLEKGVVPWFQPWVNVNGDMPSNFFSKTPYRGANVMTLAITGLAKNYPTNFYGTFAQIQKAGGQVRKGEKAAPVVFWKFFKEDTEGAQEGETKSHGDKRPPMLRYYSVFNIAQADFAFPLQMPEPPTAPGTFQILDNAETIARDYFARPGAPKLEHGTDRASYSPMKDRVAMPSPEQFFKADGYYSTLFHEMTHSTGHKSRLNRRIEGAPGSLDYSKEELVAELGAAFLRARAGIRTVQEDEQSAAYIASWLKVLRHDKKLVVFAAAQAQKAADFIDPAPVEQEAEAAQVA